MCELTRVQTDKNHKTHYKKRFVFCYRKTNYLSFSNLQDLVNENLKFKKITRSKYTGIVNKIIEFQTISLSKS